MFFNLSILIPLIGCTPWTISKGVWDICVPKLLGIASCSTSPRWNKPNHVTFWLNINQCSMSTNGLCGIFTHTLYPFDKKRLNFCSAYTIINIPSFHTIHHEYIRCVNKQMSRKCFAFGSPCMIYEVIFQLIVFVVWKHCYD